MAELFVNMLRAFLRKLAQLMIWRHRPGIIGVTGTAGKTSTKLAIAAVLSSRRRVRVSSGNLNNELGLPLAILGDWSEDELRLVSRATPAGSRKGEKMKFWLKVIATSAWRVVFPTDEYPEILVLEYGADRPGNIKALLEIARPNVSVITAIGEIPVHVEFYPGPQEVAREKGRLIEYLPVGGFAILNGDDPLARGLQARTRAKIATFGFEKGNDIRISRFENKIKDGVPAGISFKLENGASIVPVRIERAFGRAHAYAAAAAAAVGVTFGMNLVTISEALAHYAPPESRMTFVKGIKESWIIDDAYNASPLATQSALEALASIPAKRKVAVLGDMLELGKFTIEAHERAGLQAARAANVLVTVGPNARFMAEGARKGRMKSANIYAFENIDEAERSIKALIKKGDLVLVKGSHAMGLEKIVSALRA